MHGHAGKNNQYSACYRCWIFHLQIYRLSHGTQQVNMKTLWYNNSVLWILILGLFCGINVFFLLGNVPVEAWDEARHGVSAYEMLVSHAWIVNTYRGEVDYWNLKPPLSFWTTIFSYKLFGINSFGLRAASAFFGIATIGMTVAFAWRAFSRNVGILSGFFLVTAYSFVVTHNMRHGDPDSLYIFLTTGATFAVLLSAPRPRLLWLSAFLLSLAFLTKSFHVGAFGITLLSIAFAMHRFRLFSPRILVGCLACGLLPVAVWAGLRYSHDGWDFLGKMFVVDVWNRATTIVEGHQQSASHYFSILFNDFKYIIKFCLCIFVLVIIFQYKKTIHFFIQRWKQGNIRLVVYLAICSLIPFIIFQLSASKLKWYVYPIEPFIAILLAVMTHNLYILIKDIQFFKYTLTIFICILCACIVFQEIKIVKNNIRQARTTVFPQETLIGIEKEKQGRAVYLEGHDWRQDAVLADLFKGLQPEDSGRAAWEKDESGYALLISPNGDLWQQNQSEPLFKHDELVH